MVLAGLSIHELQTGGFNPNLFNGIESALAFTSVATTIVTTSLIGYRIQRHFRENRASGSNGTFKHILNIVIESAAIYSLLLLMDAISIIVPPFNELGTPWANVEYYVESILIVVAGIAPTVIVARSSVARRAENDAFAITRVSGLRFESAGGRVHHGQNPSTIGSGSSNDSEIIVLSSEDPEKQSNGTQSTL
ncbi:hypothetical protein JR316_0011998 [Psilocybe cubensis]|uniref:Uncharacterized protein n=2 Tax=Psilocybe cubensis TaxID=181762 RepID=A0ACB8GLA7_PSICU|nr:hypothetical protein JR316_0011998 [Psilocybe cubensis]KAH9476423.1 hypothetical protein JR316_0011998 [Psilocybe cubensis]